MQLIYHIKDDLLYQSNSSTTTKLPIRNNSYVLTSNGSVPVWSPPYVAATPNLNQVLSTGNNAGLNNINMNNNSITNASSVKATVFNGILNGNASSASTANSCSGNSLTATTATNALACSGNSATATTASSCSGNSLTAG